MNKNEDDSASHIPETSSAKPMDSKRDVEKSPDAKTDQDFPGYPHYPAKQDEMGQESGNNRVDANLEESGGGQNVSGVSQRYKTVHQDSNVAASPADGEQQGLAAVNSTSDEIGLPQNVSNDELKIDESGNH